MNSKPGPISADVNPPDTAALANWPAGARERRAALWAVLVSVVFFVLAAPYAKQPLPQVWAFIPIYASALILNDLITALLLFGQFRIARSKALLVLASGYVFTALATVTHSLSFPGLFAAGGLFGAGPQTTAWIYMFWHGGFPLFVAAYALLRRRPDDTLSDSFGNKPAIGIAVLSVAALAGAFFVVATVGHDALPAIMRGNRYTPAMIVVVSSVWLASLGALLLLWRMRARSVLDLWLLVVMCAWLFDVALSAMLNAGRFDLGFYLGRIYGLLAASFVLGVLLLENGLLHASLVRAHKQELQRATDLQRLSEQLETVNAQLADSNLRLQDQTRLKTEFLANMSHELRTPLNAIIGFSDMLKDGMAGDADKQRQFASHIFRCGQHLLALINDILDMSKIEAGKVEMTMDRVHLEAALADVQSLLANQAGLKQVRLEVEQRSDLGVLRADARRLKQILLNLLSNAMKFTPAAGTVRLSAEVVARSRAERALPGFAAGVRQPLPDSVFERFVEISVHDSGIGIAPDDLHRLFSPFVQIRNDVTRESEGTGLGLVMVHRLAELHGGTVAVTSEPGRGSCFTVWIPWRDDAAVAAAPTMPLQAGLLLPPGLGAAANKAC